MCSWDEDTVTMAVEAVRDMGPAAPIQALFLASTTHPFAVRQNAGIVANALNLGSDLRTMDVAGSLRASTTALMSALDAAAAGTQAIVVAADRRQARAGSPMEMLSGDGAAALQAGSEGEIATLLGSATVAADFIDHFRASGDAFDYGWEDRWIRDEGWLKLVPQAVSQALARAGVAPSDVDRLIVPCHLMRVPESVAKACGIAAGAVADPMMSTVGQCGTAQPLLMLAAELSSAAPGQTIVVTGFGQGCDALVFRVTDAIGAARPNRGVAGWLERRVEEINYHKFLTYSGVVEREYGKAAELDRAPALTAQYRNREGVTGFVGGRCEPLRHGAVPEGDLLRESELRRQGHARTPSHGGRAGQGEDLYRGPSRVLHGSARLFGPRRVRGRRANHGGVHGGGSRELRRRHTDEHALQNQACR